MPYGSALSPYTIPTASSTVGPTYASNVSECLTTLKTVLEAAVTPSGMDINADLSFLSSGTYSNITNLKSAQLYSNAAALDAGTFVRAVYSTGGELYYNDASGNQVQITSGGSVNTASVGSITGSGYGSGGVVVNWSSGDNGYQFKLGGGADDYADLLCDDLRLNDGSSNFITLQAPSISTNYAWTLPSALPASTSLLTVSSGGTIAQSRDPSVDTVTTSGAAIIGTTATVGTGLTVTSGGATVTAGGLTVTAGNAAVSSGTLSVSGLITATSGLTAGSNAHITVSGSGRYKHGTMRYTMFPTMGVAIDGSPSLTTLATTNYPIWTEGSASGTLVYPLLLPDGVTIETITVMVNQPAGSGGGDAQIALRYLNLTESDAGDTDPATINSWNDPDREVAVSSTTHTSDADDDWYSLTNSPNHTLDYNGTYGFSARYYFITVVWTYSAVAKQYGGIVVTYSRS